MYFLNILMQIHGQLIIHSPSKNNGYRMIKPVKLSASLEDYIEAIYNIICEKQVARGKDIAAQLDVSGASVTEALRSLSQKGLINYAPYEAITLTETGREVARDVVNRHNALKQFFIKILDISEDVAEIGACRVEHAAPQKIIDQMINFIEFIEAYPIDSNKLARDFTTFCREKSAE
ncbi:MAG: metal-dependent transcriptional regulator [Desulfobulbaceae bacterium]|nr:metal-dependent transcriptional regulator [Desulfobulbaceae bacterium]